MSVLITTQLHHYLAGYISDNGFFRGIMDVLSDSLAKAQAKLTFEFTQEKANYWRYGQYRLWQASGQLVLCPDGTMWSADGREYRKSGYKWLLVRPQQVQLAQAQHLADRMRKKQEIRDEVVDVLKRINGITANEQVGYLHGLLFCLGYDTANANSFIFRNTPYEQGIKVDW